MAQLEVVDGGLNGAAAKRPLGVLAWMWRHPLAVCLPAQAILLLAGLGRLPVWGDEQTSFDRAILGAVPANTVHPGLYFLLLRGWLSALCDGPCIVGARALSALFVLAATVAIDRCWLRALEERERRWFLVLWTLSPALVLYGRMARSYSLQLLLASVALAAGGRFAARSTPSALLTYVAAAAVLFSTHYLPGVAVVGGVLAAMAWRALAAPRASAVWAALLPPILVGLALTPGLARFATAVGQLAQHSGYHLIGRAGDVGLALAFTALSFSVGETLWPWMLVGAALLAPLVVAMLLRGLRPAPAWLGIVVPAAVIGFVGAQQWVSYAFVPARLLFLLPFCLLLFVRGAQRHGGLGTVACAAAVLLSLAGIAAYFGQVDFLNKAYCVPSEAIAERILSGSADGRVTVILDHHSSDFSAVAARLPRDARVVDVIDGPSAARAVGLAGEPGLRQAWFVHSTHDVSAAQWNAMVRDAFSARLPVRRTELVPYTDVDRWLMRLAGWPIRPRHAVEVLEFGGPGR